MADNANIVVTFKSVLSETDTASEDVSLSLEQLGTTDENAFLSCLGGCSSSQGSGTTTDPVGNLNRYLDCMTGCNEHCDPTQEILIKVVTNPDNLNYTLKTTHGTLGAKTVEQDNYAESHDVSLDSTLVLDESLENLGADWEGDVWNEYGELISPPSISWNPETRTLSWNQNVVGTIRVTAVETYDVWSLQVEPRTDSTTETAWSATVRAFYMDGGTPSMREIKIREPNISGPCGYGYSVGFTSDDEDRCWEIIHWLDPCTGEEDLSRQEKQEVPCEGLDG